MDKYYQKTYRDGEIYWYVSTDYPGIWPVVVFNGGLDYHGSTGLALYKADGLIKGQALPSDFRNFENYFKLETAPDLCVFESFHLACEHLRSKLTRKLKYTLRSAHKVGEAIEAVERLEEEEPYKHAIYYV